MSVKARRASGTRCEGNDEFHHATAPRESGAVERLLASAYQEGPAEGDCAHHGGDNGRCATGVLVTRRTDDAGDPIGYLLMSSDTA